MTAPDTLRDTRIPLNNGSGAMPAVGFGTLIPDPVATQQATKTALEVGFRLFDCAERYRNEEAVGEAMQEVFRAGAIRREDVFVTTKLWNTNHRPERVKPAFDASRRRLQIDTVDCYLIHTPFAFRPYATDPLISALLSSRKSKSTVASILPSPFAPPARPPSSRSIAPCNEA
jgi:diketogulonate reductase-like aldo/keto reductase